MLDASILPEGKLPEYWATLSYQREIQVGLFAKQIIERQFHAILRLEPGVLQGQDPEDLHHMRVAFRRLRTAIEIFQNVIKLPKALSLAKIRRFSKILGILRDFDVQLESLKTDYADPTAEIDQQTIIRLDRKLRKQRRKADQSVKKLLQSKPYRHFCQNCDGWLKTPQYLPLAQVPLQEILPELLLPLVAQLFLHPAWHLSIVDVNVETSALMHDLRKCCKHVRYQSEFFAQYYGQDFTNWIRGLKELQDRLGQLQDSYVFHEMLQTLTLPDREQPELHEISAAQGLTALSSWEEHRQNYLNLAFRRQLFQMILAPDCDMKRSPLHEVP